jgi:hypothetical protein
MALQNFPASLQPIIQQGFLEQRFQTYLQSALGYRMAAIREDFATNIGETLTKTRPGLKAPTITPINPTGITNFDNGLSPSTFTIEQFKLTLNMYGDTIDLNTVTNRVGIVEQFLHNSQVNAIQAGQSLDRLARNKLFAGYLSGNTRVRTALGSPTATVSVDDINGFDTVLVNGIPTSVSASNPLSVTVGSSVYTLIGAAPDATNVSTVAVPFGFALGTAQTALAAGAGAAPGRSGVLTFSSNVATSDGTLYSAITAAVGSVILRPNARNSTAALNVGDLFTMSTVLDAVAYLRRNAVPAINGYYNCHLDPVSARQLFADPDFKQLFQGQQASQEYRMGKVIELLDVRFVPTTEAPVQAHPTIANAVVRRPIIVGAGALIEGDFAGMGAMDTADDGAIVDIVDKVVQVTREPMDRLRQIIAQSWYWIGDFCAPTDYTLNASIVPSASNANFKRACVIEHLG